MEEIERCQTMVIGGVVLHIYARKMEDKAWELVVENASGAQSVWTDFFPSAESAICAGLAAVEAEGAQEFADVEGFEYLHDH
jgi:hypothetical protein